MKSTGKQPGNKLTSQVQQTSENLQERISRRAYGLYIERGEQSDPHQNWLDAEREIVGAVAQSVSEQTQTASVKRAG